MAKDNINPDHYRASTSLECIEVMELLLGYKAVGYFCLCNAFKYMWRFKHKNGKEDLTKAGWYLDWIEHKIGLNYQFEVQVITAYERLRNLHINIWDKIANKEVVLDD